MRKKTLLIGMLPLFGASPGMAEDLVVELMKSNAENIELVQDAEYDVAYGNIGNTSQNTIIGLGEVDFGEDGSNYQATGVEFANGWGTYGEAKYVVLSAGATPEEAVPFNEIRVERTFGYHQFDMFAENMKDSEGFTRPTGVQKVWLSFRDGNGNLRSAKFYAEALPDGTEGLQPWPSETEGYADIAIVVDGSQMVKAVETPGDQEEDPYKDALYDEERGCWGGTSNGLIVKSAEEIDFGNGDFRQLVAYIGHDGERYMEYMEFYIDEATPENLIARTWAGINIQEWYSFTPVATKLKEVTGSHYLLVKWGDATNLQKVELVRDSVWFENPDCGVVYENEEPSENAVMFTTTGESGSITGTDANQGITWEVIKPISGDAYCEGSNIGYTKAGVVVAYRGIDFKDAYYKRVFINASCDKTYIGSTVEEANFSLYVDLNDIDWGNVTNLDELSAALEDRDPVAVVRAQGTGGWDNKLTTAGDLQPLEGIHDLYVVYNLPDRDNIGANIYGLYLDPGQNPAGTDLFIALMKSNAENIELVQDAEFDPGYGNIGQTSQNTIIGLGEVDFGEDGSNYQATGVEFANGWGTYGEAKYVVLSAGATPEEAVPFNEIRVERTFGYHQFDMFAENMKDSEGFTRPTGVQKVWLSFRDGNGNLRSAKFYAEALPDGTEGLQPWPSETEGYADIATVVDGSQMVKAVETPGVQEEDPYKDALYDEERGCWGGTSNGLIVKSAEVIDFGNGDFRQLVAYIGHDGERYMEYMEFYIDEATPENLIARTWAGINLSEWYSFTPVATKLKEVTGSHYLLVKWGDDTNLQKVELVRDSVWFENPDCGVVYENEEPSENAVVYVTTGESGAITGTDVNHGNTWEVIRPVSGDAYCEGSNIGFTRAGTVVVWRDIDFKNALYKKVFINASCDKNYIGGTAEEANFSLYVDLDDLEWDYINNPDELAAALEGREPVAVVRAQGTGGWDNKLTTGGDLQPLEGIHDLYVVYNLPNRDNIGANIYGLYLDPQGGNGIQSAISGTEGIQAYAADGSIVINANSAIRAEVYSVNGTTVASQKLPAGMNAISNLAPGIYILKATDGQNGVMTKKLIVK